MGINRVAHILRFTLVFSFLAFVVACGEEGGDGDEAGDEGNKSNAEALAGTWRLSTVNGNAPAESDWLTWVFTRTTMSITSDLDCIEVYTYSATESEITTTLTSQEGTECGDEVGDIEVFPYELNGDTLTVDVSEDEDLEIAVFVFTKK
jgi:hypothetical protein